MRGTGAITRSSSFVSDMPAAPWSLSDRLVDRLPSWRYCVDGSCPCRTASITLVRRTVSGGVSGRPRTRSTGSATWDATFERTAQPRFQYGSLRMLKPASAAPRSCGHSPHGPRDLGLQALEAQADRRGDPGIARLVGRDREMAAGHAALGEGVADRTEGPSRPRPGRSARSAPRRPAAHDRSGGIRGRTRSRRPLAMVEAGRAVHEHVDRAWPVGEHDRMPLALVGRVDRARDPRSGAQAASAATSAAAGARRGPMRVRAGWCGNRRAMAVPRAEIHVPGGGHQSVMNPNRPL